MLEWSRFNMIKVIHPIHAIDQAKKGLPCNKGIGFKGAWHQISTLTTGNIYVISQLLSALTFRKHTQANLFSTFYIFLLDFVFQLNSIVQKSDNARFVDF